MNADKRGSGAGRLKNAYVFGCMPFSPTYIYLRPSAFIRG
jgi:hypothetical protein